MLQKHNCQWQSGLAFITVSPGQKWLCVEVIWHLQKGCKTLKNSIYSCMNGTSELDTTTESKLADNKACCKWGVQVFMCSYKHGAYPGLCKQSVSSAVTECVLCGCNAESPRASVCVRACLCQKYCCMCWKYKQVIMTHISFFVIRWWPLAAVVIITVERRKWGEVVLRLKSWGWKDGLSKHRTFSQEAALHVQHDTRSWGWILWIYSHNVT